ncbi:MAG: cobalt transporter CbiM [Burkholderiales bacterium]|nr:cobalt transporter CbiM [Burkholderiales bacterium]
MHISEGVLSLPVLVGGGGLATAAVAVGLRRTPDSRIALAGVLCAMFFVASLIHIPVGVTSVHLVLNGLCGILLGWTAVPVIVVALLLQALLFGFGGLTVLGVNTVVMALPALLCCAIYRAGGGPVTSRAALWRGGIAGAGGIAVGIALMVSALWLTGGRSFLPLIGTVMLVHLPVMAIEAVITAMIAAALLRAQPAWLNRGGLA